MIKMTGKKKVVAGVIILLVVCIGIFFIFGKSKKEEKTEQPLVYQDGAITEDGIDKIPPKMTSNDKKDIAERIEKTKTKYVPKVEYYTDTQEEADAKAEAISKEENPKAKVVKETTKAKETEKATVYENKYYSVDMNRKHSIGVGAEVVDKEAYITTSYRNRETTYRVAYSPNSKKWGVGVEYSVAKW